MTCEIPNCDKRATKSVVIRVTDDDNGKLIDVCKEHFLYFEKIVTKQNKEKWK